MCSSQRKGDYKKWKWFDYCLWHAIDELSCFEKGDFKVYTGLSGVKSNIKETSGHFVTYVSTSWRKEVSRAFMKGNKGMIIEIDKQYKNNWDVHCCDVSWISKFPDECEVLFARSARKYDGGMYGDTINMLMLDMVTKARYVVLDESNGVQTVSLEFDALKQKV